MSEFGVVAGEYARSRPRYPEELFEWIALNSPGHSVAWDCACGNGQAAQGLARYFDRVEATDVSAQQIGHAIAGRGVSFSVAPAEHTPFPSSHFDCVVVAQALHWFDYSTWWPELRRVARPGALFAAWGYDWFECDAAVQEQLVEPFREIIAQYWAPNNRILWNGYRQEDIQFPYARITPPEFAIEVRWDPGQLLAYMRTWSAFVRSQADPSSKAAIDALLEHVRLPEDLMTVRMPLKIVGGHVE